MIELLQFRYSPFNEKVRWALDHKRVPHIRRAVLPGPHLPVIKRLTGHTNTPVLKTAEHALEGSAQILAWLEAHHPTPALMPTNPADALEALRIQSWFDDVITPRMRRPVLDALLASPRYFANVFGAGHSNFVQRAYALTLPLAKPLVRKSNGISDGASVADGYAAMLEALDFVHERSEATGYLVGQEFSLADLTAASALAMVLDIAQSPMSKPVPHCAEFAALLMRNAQHPAALWVRTMYQRHRSATCDFNGRSDY